MVKLGKKTSLRQAKSLALQYSFFVLATISYLVVLVGTIAFFINNLSPEFLTYLKDEYLFEMPSLVQTALDWFGDIMAPYNVFELAIISYGGFFTYAFGYIFFFHSAMSNLYREGLHFPSISPAGSWGWYMVPIANLFLPYRAMSEIYIGSRDPEEKKKISTKRLRIWWSFFLFSQLGIGTLFFLNALDIKEGGKGFSLEFVSFLGISNIVCFMLFILFTWNIAERIYKGQRKHFRS